MNFQNRSNDCAFKNSCQSLGLRIMSRNRIFSAQTSNCSPSVVSIWSNYVLFLGCSKMLKVSFFHIIVSAVSYRSARRNSRLFLASCLQLLLSAEIPRVVLLLVSSWSKSCCLQEYRLVPSLPLSNRIGDTSPSLLRKHCADMQNELFGTRVLCS